MASTTTKNLLLSQIKSVSEDVAGPVYLVHTTTHEENAAIHKIEIPGVDPSTVEVNCVDNLLSVHCSRGDLLLTVLPTVDVTKITADIKWGLLTLTVPVPEKPVAQNIRVNIHDNVEKKPHLKSAEKFTSSEE